MSALRERLDTSPLVGFNQGNRDAWVARMAATVPAGSRVLDIGAGQCPYRPLFAHTEYCSQDFVQYHGTHDGLMREDWTYGSIDLVSDVAAIPVDDASFDVVLCTEVLEHVPKPVAVLQEAARILRPGGWLFVSAPLGSGLHQQPFHFYGGFTPHFYSRFLDEAGFDVVSVEANGGFFRHLLQEIDRAAGIIEERRPYPRWHPMHWIVRVGFRQFAPRWLARLDDEVPVSEFTIGYHVEARRRGNR